MSAHREVTAESRDVRVWLADDPIMPPDATATHLSATRERVEIVCDVDLGVLGEITVRIPTQALAALLMELP